MEMFSPLYGRVFFFLFRCGVPLSCCVVLFCSAVVFSLCSCVPLSRGSVRVKIQLFKFQGQRYQ